MKRLVVIVTLLLVLGLMPGAISAQDATPASSATPSSALLDALGYPALDITFDGKTVTGPSELTAGRYLLAVTDTTNSPDIDFNFFGATDAHSADEIISTLASSDMSQGPPPLYYEIKNAGGTSETTPSVVTLPAGEWVLTALDFKGETPSVYTQKITVTGDLPTYDAIPDAVDVTLVDLAIQMPDTIPAGPHVWQVTNTGSMPHFLDIVQASGPVTVEEAVNGAMIFVGDAGATPVAEGSNQDPQTWTELGNSGTITNGMTNLIEFDLQPGTYIAFCFEQGPGDLGLHALHGMTTVFTVE